MSTKKRPQLLGAGGWQAGERRALMHASGACGPLWAGGTDQA